MLAQEHITQEESLDSTIALLQEGYLFIGNRIDKYQSNMFETHLMGQKVVCMSGKEAAELFYNPQLFQRNGAAPKRVQKTLFGENAVQTLDGEEHIHRKHLFMLLTAPQEQRKLSELAAVKLDASIDKWVSRKKVVIFDESKEILCQTACDWAGVPLKESEIKNRADDFSLMINSFGAVGLQYWKGKMARARTERWIRGFIRDVRSGRLKALEGSALNTVAFYKELDGSLINTGMAAIELINLIRPIVAISTFITFTALSVHEHPECLEKLLSGDSNYIEMFIQEVRRFYPFSPFTGARVLKDFTFNEYKFKKGMLVLLDMYGTDHDPNIWEEPHIFNPERFKEWRRSLYNFIPQGGGDPVLTHRCPGEGITVGIMKESLKFLIDKIKFEVPKQDLNYNLSKIPTLPESGFVIDNIKRKY